MPTEWSPAIFRAHLRGGFGAALAALRIIRHPGSGVAHGVYIQPKNRVLSYDLNFKNRTPAGSPSTTAFTRGSFFFW